eukprot:Clim_evm46s11 gene=Clim_evmTU46s11
MALLWKPFLPEEREYVQVLSSIISDDSAEMYTQTRGTTVSADDVPVTRVPSMPLLSNNYRGDRRFSFNVLEFSQALGDPAPGAAALRRDSIMRFTSTNQLAYEAERDISLPPASPGVDRRLGSMDMMITGHSPSKSSFATLQRANESLTDNRGQLQAASEEQGALEERSWTEILAKDDAIVGIRRWYQSVAAHIKDFQGMLSMPDAGTTHGSDSLIMGEETFAEFLTSIANVAYPMTYTFFDILDQDAKGYLTFQDVLLVIKLYVAYYQRELRKFLFLYEDDVFNALADPVLWENVLCRNNRFAEYQPEDIEALDMEFAIRLATFDDDEDVQHLQRKKQLVQAIGKTMMATPFNGGRPPKIDRSQFVPRVAVLRGIQVLNLVGFDSESIVDMLLKDFNLREAEFLEKSQFTATLYYFFALWDRQEVVRDLNGWQAHGLGEDSRKHLLSYSKRGAENGTKQSPNKQKCTIQ